MHLVCPPGIERAQGRPGARRTRGPVCKEWWRCAHEHTGSAEASRPSLRNGFTAYTCSPRSGRARCHRRPREAFASPGLDASIGASGPHDFAVRFRRATSLAPSASIASHRAFVTFASAPHLAAMTGGVMPLICPTGKAEYFCSKGWTDFGDLPVGLICRRRWHQVALARVANHSVTKGGQSQNA